MAPKRQLGELAKEVLKDRLKQHLHDVEGRIGTWLGELSPPLPFTPPGYWGLSGPYIPPAEQDLNVLHLLRGHIRSRALWHHHAEWGVSIRRIAETGQAIWLRAGELRPSASDAFLRSGLEVAFSGACGVQVPYRLTIDYLGVHVEIARPNTLAVPVIIASSAEIRGRKVEDDLHVFIEELAGLELMAALVAEWENNMSLMRKIQDLGEKILMANEFLNPCRFCRRLWKV